MILNLSALARALQIDPRYDAAFMAGFENGQCHASGHGTPFIGVAYADPAAQWAYNVGEDLGRCHVLRPKEPM